MLFYRHTRAAAYIRATLHRYWAFALALARSEGAAQRFYSISAQIRIERKTYYEILEQIQKHDLDVTPWTLWFLACLDRVFDGAEQTLASIMDKARFWEGHRDLAFNERQRTILNRQLNGFEGKLTSSKWAVLAKCSQDTALRDIDDLLTHGVLAKDAGGGRNTRYSLVLNQEANAASAVDRGAS